MSGSLLLEKFYKVAGKSINPDNRKPFMDDDFYYATEGRFIVRTRKGNNSEELPRPCKFFYEFNWEILDTFDKGQPLTRVDITSVVYPVYKCLECDGDGWIYFHTGFNSYEGECKSCEGKGVKRPPLVWKLSKDLYYLLSDLDFITRIFGDIEYLVPDKKGSIAFRFMGGDGFLLLSQLTDRDVFDPYEQKNLFVRDKIYSPLRIASVDKTTAQTIARRYLSREIELKYHEDTSGMGLYGFNPQNDHLFSFGLHSSLKVGCGRYISVSKRSGKVTAVGVMGE